jgi:molecular chaperone HscB
MDPFQTLGLPRAYTLDPSALEQRYRDLQRALHPDKHASGTPSARRLSLSKAVEVNEAYRVLKDDVRRAESLLALLGRAASETAADPELLMEVMELREALSEAKHEKDLARVRTLASDVTRRAARAQRELAAAFEAADLPTAGARLSQLKYFKRFLDEVSVIEEEAIG